MRPIKAILIDPFALTVSEVEYDGDDYKQIYRLLSHRVHPVDTFRLASIHMLKVHRDGMFVDDNELANGPVRLFQVGGEKPPVAGKGLIVGSDEEGNSQSHVISLDLVRAATVFLHLTDKSLTICKTPME
jgi:hypothetical protein